MQQTAGENNKIFNNVWCSFFVSLSVCLGVSLCFLYWFNYCLGLFWNFLVNGLSIKNYNNHKKNRLEMIRKDNGGLGFFFLVILSFATEELSLLRLSFTCRQTILFFILWYVENGYRFWSVIKWLISKYYKRS